MKKTIYTINTLLFLISILLLSFIVYVLYSAYLPKPISLNSIITTTNLQTIKTNGHHLPNEIQIKNKLKQQYQNLLVDKITIKINATTATIISADPKIYNDSVDINYILDKSLENQIDLNQSYQANSTWINQRGYKGLWINNNQPTVDEKNLTNAFLSSSQYPNLPFYEKQEFNSYDQLIKHLNPTLKESWEYIVDNFCNTYKEKLKELILLFYNMLANIFNKNNINNILSKIEIKQLDGLGFANFHDRHIELHTKTIRCDYANTAIDEWTRGFKTSNSIFKTLIHELGHIVHYYYDFNNIDIVFHLKEFLKSKIINFNNSHIDIENVFKSFAFSSYALKTNGEFMAEGFAYWFLATDDLKTKAWEFLHEYFTNYLPKKLI